MRSIRLGLAIVLATLLAIVVFVRPAMLALVTNSDALLPADLIWELLNRPHAWHSFQWPRIPSLVPDLLVYGALQAPFGWRWAQLGYGVFSLLSVAGLAAITATLGGRRTAFVVFLGLVAIVLAAEWTLTSTAWHLHLLAPAYHSGAFILSLLTLITVASRRLGFMAVLAALGTVSDRMFIGTFFLPVTVGLFWLHRRGEMSRGQALRIAIWALGGCTLGIVADGVVFPRLLFRQADVAIAPMALLRHIATAFGDRSTWYAIALDATLIWPTCRLTMPARTRFWWIVASVASTGSLLLGLGLWDDDGAQRYLSAVLWWPLILWAPLLAQSIGRYAEVTALAVLAAVVASFAAALPKRHPLLAWQDPIAACLAPTGLQAGLADYWPARRMSVATDWRLQVMQVGERGGTRVWGNDPTWYTQDRDRPGQAPAFSFVVMRGLNAAAIGAGYGQPDRVLRCPDSDVWVYDDSARVSAGLASASPGLVPRGRAVCVGPDRLSRRGGALPTGPLKVGSDRNTSRPVTWGPNLDLHAGRWRVALTYRLRTDRPGADRWLINGLYGTLHLAEAILPPTGDEPETVSADITLDREMQAVEVPTYLAGTATLEILRASFTPLEPQAAACD